MYCPKCGKETTENATFCAGCGVSLAGGQPAKKRVLSTIAGIVEIVAGGLTALVAIVYVAAILGILATVGGICALRRKRWGWALAGAVGGVLPFFPLGIASTILTVMAREEFER